MSYLMAIIFYIVGMLEMFKPHRSENLLIGYFIVSALFTIAGGITSGRKK